MSFHEVRFPTTVARGASGGPERRTEIVTLGSGFEERNAVWSQSRRRYNAGYGVKSLDDLHAVLAFFEAREGRLYGFRWKDAGDFKSCPPLQTVAAGDQTIGIGDDGETEFQLTKTYVSGSASHVRQIAKPVAGSVLVAVDGAAQTLGVDVTLDAATGLLTFAAPPAADAVITAGFEFDVPVRFDSDSLEINLAAFDAGEIPSIPIIEVRL